MHWPEPFNFIPDRFCDDGRVSARIDSLGLCPPELWHPMSVREAGTAGLREGVPLALRGGLRAWLLQAGMTFPELGSRGMLRLDWFVPDVPSASTAWPVHVEHADDSRLLDTVT